MSPGLRALGRYGMLAVIALAGQALTAYGQNGPFLTSAGPVNRSMGGASVAAPLDSLGATFWNPATDTSALLNSMDFGLELLDVQTTLSSRYPANLFGPGAPQVPLAGSTKGDNGVSALPSLGLIYRPDESQLTYGLGVFPVAGFSVNYPASSLLAPGSTNPILTPQAANGGLGLGSIYSNLQVIQIAPTLSLQLTDQLSIGFGPTVSLALLQADPLFVGGVDPNGNYPTGTHSHMTWGARLPDRSAPQVE